MLRIRAAYLHGVLLVLTAVAYHPIWRNDFVDMDDEKYITTNPWVREGLSWPGFRWAWMTDHGRYWMPLSWLSLQADVQFLCGRDDSGGPALAPAIFHGENLLWHAASVLLLFALLQRLTGARWCSFLVAGLFAVHPMHVESVAWAAERKDVLSTFFGILTVWAYARYVEAPGWRRYLLVIAAFLASLLAKPMLVTLPLLLLFLDFWPLHRLVSPGTGPRSLFGLVLEKVPLMLIAATIVVLTLLMHHNYGADVPLDVVSLPARVANAFAAYGWYVSHTLLPRQLCAFYPHAQDDWSATTIAAGTATVAIITGLTTWQARQRPWLLVGWLWFVIALVPVLGLTQSGMQAWADRFCYWPHIGLFIAAVWALAELAERLHVPAAVWGAVAALALTGLAAATWIQVGYWRDTPTLWERVLAVTGDDRLAHPNLGLYYYEHGQLDQAQVHLAEALRRHPNAADMHNALGVTLLMLGREDAGAEHLRRALELVPTASATWCHLGLVRLRQGRPGEAVDCYRRAMELDHGAPDTMAMLGQALWADGQRAEAVSTLHAALDADPREGHAWYGLGVALLADGRIEEAIEALTQARRFKPELVATHSELGVALGRAGRWADAVGAQAIALQMQREREERLGRMGGRISTADGIAARVSYQCRLGFALACCGDRPGAREAYAAATALDPRWPDAFAAKAWMLATDSNESGRDPQTAYELASQAVDSAGEPSALLLDALAAAEAARGNFREATAIAKRAIEKARTAGDIALVKAIQERVRLYVARKPACASTHRGSR
jgi:tetratricopeptide (TPR) repeat protein